MSQSISDEQKEIPSITISNLSNYCHFNCDQILWNALNYKRSTEQSPLKEVFQRRSKEIKQNILKHLKEDVIDHNDKNPSELRKILQDAQIGQFLYRLKFEVPDDLYNELGIKEIVKIESFIPDFVEVIEEDGEKRLRIWDAKASKEVLVSHQVKNLRGVSISRSGGLFLSSSENLKRQTFRIDFLSPKVKQLLKNDLLRIASSSKVSWHYNARCKNCEFVNDCRKDAKGTMAMIPYLSMENALFLKRVFRNGKSKENAMLNESEVDIEDLCDISKPTIDNKKEKVNEEEPDLKYLVEYVNSFEKHVPKINRKIKQIIKYNEDLKMSPYLDIHETENVQFIGIPTATFPQKTDHNLVIAISLDPFDSYPFGWAICLYTSDGKITEDFQNAESIYKSKDKTLLAFISLMEKFVTSLIDIFQYLSEKKSRACIFVYTEQEKITIQDSLIKLITLNSDKISKEIQDAATQCLFNLFEDCSALLAVGSDDSESSELPNEWNEFPRLIVLEHSVRENIAISVPGFYRVIDIWEKMVKPILKDQELLKNLESHIFNIDLENIYFKWDSDIVTKETINQSHLYRSEFVNAVIQAYYTLLKKLTNDIASKLIFYPQEFVLSKVKSFRNHYLGKLYFFKQFEAITTCSRIKEDRLNDFIKGETINGIRVKLEKFVKKENYEWIVSFIVLNHDSKSFVPEPKTFKEYILVNDTMEGTLDAIRFPDMKFKDKFWGYPLSVLALIDVENNYMFKITLKGIFKKKMNIGATYRLYKRYIDFNSDKILNTLIKIDEQSSSLFLNLLKDPNEWGTSSLFEEPNYLKELKATAFELFDMSTSQRDISVSLLNKKLQIIWGPPGSGKTHFLALFVLRYLNIANPQPTGNNNNFIIGITAFTRTAINNLLERIARIKDKRQSDFLLARMVSESTKNTLDGVKDYKAKILQEKIAKSSIPDKYIIVGGTVWDWYKFRKDWKNWKGCDIMIIDEGSQLLTSDACVVIESLNPNHGKLIIAGDHMQLGPIIQNKYPDFSENHPLILGSIQQCLMKKEDCSIFNEGDFFIKKGEKRDFGPCTLMLKDNWRMNDELNSFFQTIYGDDYISHNPSLALNFEDDKLSHIEPAIRKILLPGSGITLVKLSLKNHEELESLSEKILREEADVVAKIVSAYFDASRKTNQDSDKPSLFIVTPHHRQRCAITSRVTEYLSNPEFSLNINTVEKMQGQEADLVIACFGFLDADEIARESNFLFDRNRTGIFTNKKTSEGWIYISMIESWVRQKEKEIIEWVIDEDPVI
ncbi:43143_t:CDS:10 [Gigaspora margarita]|uniref:43143_t:CDS:1 n=1 Tax=Gigaspora margarita TaxID=4874 RepID=A0ABM8W3E3_GIGMA|nr:43143_t:CDS:10 [Gigaspora margarita]